MGHGQKKSNGMGLFAKILAFALATEEQGRKSLHGHFLIFVECWKEILEILQKRKWNENSDEYMSFKKACK